MLNTENTKGMDHMTSEQVRMVLCIFSTIYVLTVFRTEIGQKLCLNLERF